VSQIEIDSISGQQPAHGMGDGCSTASEQQMKMIADQCPRIASRLGLAEQSAETIQKPLSVGIVQKNLLAVDTARNHVMQRARCIDSRFSWHAP
jgi:hypothetical protein